MSAELMQRGQENPRKDGEVNRWAINWRRDKIGHYGIEYNDRLMDALFLVAVLRQNKLRVLVRNERRTERL